MTPRQIQLVRESWQQVLPVADDAAQLFLVRLFSLDPSLRARFPGDMEEHARAWAAKIDSAVGSLGRPDAEGVRDAEQDKATEALIWTLQKGLGGAFTPEVKQAWVAARVAA